MKIRTKLTLIFFVIVIIILTAVSLAIYFFSADHREQDFYMRMRNKAENTAKLLIEVDEVDVALLRRIERDNPSNLPRERIKIFNYRNEVLYSTDLQNELPVDNELLSEIRLKGDIKFAHGEYEVLGFLFAYKYDRFTVIVGAKDIYGFKKIANLKQILVIVFAASLILISVSGWIYAGKVLSPISNIVNEVDNISEANLDQRLNEGNGNDELAKLSQTFNSMLDRLESSFVAQKNFIANASHELRTPITAIAGEIEVTLLQQRAPEEYVKVLKSLLEDAKALGRLSTQLLLLAQTTSSTRHRSFAPVRVDEVLWQAQAELRKVQPSYGVQIGFDLALNDENLVLLGDEQLIKVVCLNLMDNGCKYSKDNKVNVTLSSPDQSFLKIDFVNSGTDLPKEELDKIFNPFFRGKNAANIQGSGIGLSLVQRIMAFHQGLIDVNVADNEVHFTLAFPIGNSGLV